MCICARAIFWTLTNYFLLNAMSTGYLTSLAPMVLPGSQNSSLVFWYFHFPIFFFLFWARDQGEYNKDCCCCDKRIFMKLCTNRPYNSQLCLPELELLDSVGTLPTEYYKNEFDPHTWIMCAWPQQYWKCCVKDPTLLRYKLWSSLLTIF